MCYIIWIRNISRTRSGAVMQPKPVPSREDAEDSEKRKRGDSMSEKEKEIIRKVAHALPEMSDMDKGYFLGFAEAMASKKTVEAEGQSKGESVKKED